MTVHCCPADGLLFLPCCAKAPFAVPPTDQITRNPDLVTCPGNQPREPLYTLPRLGHGACWSAIAAEIAADTTQLAPNPWTPDPEEEA